MRIVLFILLGFVLGMGAAFAQDEVPVETPIRTGPVWDNSSQSEDWSVMAFVGNKVFVEERAKPEYMDIEMPDGSIVTRSLPAFDTRYEARYEILDMVEGSHEELTIDFVAYDHYGRPSFPHINPVLLFVVSHDSEWVHSKYLYYPVRRTTDGDWAICGKTYVHKGASDTHKKLARTYEEPIGFIDPPELPDGTVCNTGTRAHNLFDIQEKMRFVPRRSKVLCNREIGIKDYYTAGIGSGPFAKIEGQKHAACMERLNVATLSKGQRH